MTLAPKADVFDAYDGSSGGLMQRTPLLLKTLCSRAAKLQPDEQVWTRIADGYHKLSWRELSRRAKMLASSLQKFGIKFSDRIATLEFNTARHLQLYYAVPCMGAVLNPLNIRLHPKEIGYIINDAQDRVVFVGEELVPILQKVEKECPDLFKCVELVVVCGKNEKPLAEGWQDKDCCKLAVKTVSYEDFIAKGDPNFVYPDFDENAAMGLCYTSGTTGKPKGVLYSHRSTYLHTMVLLAADSMGVSAIDSCLPIVPQFHVLSWGQPYVALTTGCRYCQFNKYAKPQDVLNFIIDAEVTFACGVPTIWQEVRSELTANPEKYKGRLKLKNIVCGGSAPPSEMMVWYLKQWNVEFKHAWGMTECNPIGTISNQFGKRKHLRETEDQRAAHVRKMGLFVPGLECKIVDPEDYSKELPWDGKSAGELLVKGPWIAGAYYHNRAPEKFYKGYLVTGDVATMDSEQYMVLRDRSKDLVKSGGEWISSIDMENAITAVDGVTQACVVGVPHPKWDERPICIIRLAEDAKETDAKAWLKTIRQHLSSSFAKFQLPDDCLIWKTIPETSTRKMNKKEVRAKLKEQGYVHPKLSEEEQKAMESEKLSRDFFDGTVTLQCDLPVQEEVWDGFPPAPQAEASCAGGQSGGCTIL